MTTGPTLLVHGGAWALPDDAVEAHERGIRAALAAGYAVFSKGGSAVDAAEAAVASMEDDDTFDAGRGSFLTRDGRVQMDALLMDGATLRTGGVACVERIRNPIHASRLVLEKSPHVYFVGVGAERFARQHGMVLCDNTELILPRERERLIQFQRAELLGAEDTTFSGVRGNSLRVGQSELRLRKGDLERTPLNVQHADVQAGQAVSASVREALEFLPADDPTLNSHDTVGAVALDGVGHLAAATSTGGTLSKAPGRVGDSSLIGCGCYADDQSAAASLTGWGEPIMKLVLGKWAVDRVAGGSAPQAAAAAAIEYVYDRLGGHAGIILLGPDGRFGVAHNTPRMAWGLQTAKGTEVGVTRNR